jgi:CheY-like chemotaxis protein
MTVPSHIFDKDPLSNVKILIVEDNPMNVLVLQNFLKRWGAEFELAQNGKEAVEIFDSAVHHIILMDLHMPVMDGYEATRLLRSRGENTPIIALTATVAHDVKEQISRIGINDIVTKPFVPDNLLQVILNHVNSR